MSNHWMVLEIHRPFVVFNDDGQLSMEPINDDDLEPVELAATAPTFCASCAWSSGCEWYFVIGAEGIVLLNLDGSGVYCRKRSAMFFDAFVRAPIGKRSR